MDVATLAGMMLSRTLVRSVPHQIPQIADGRVRPEHIGYNAAITVLLTIDWKEPSQVSETDYSGKASLAHPMPLPITGK